MNRHKELWLEDGEGVGDGRAEVSPTVGGDGGQAAVSFTPDTDGTGSSFLLDSFLSALLKKMIQWCVGSSSLFLIRDDMIALDCIVNGRCNLPVPFYIHVLCLKTNSASSNRENPPAISCVMNLFSSSVTSSSCLSLMFPWASSSIRSSLVNFSCCTARSSMKSSSCRSSLK